MHPKVVREKLIELNNRLRILILQNVREEDGYDDQMLMEMHDITKQILDLKQMIGGKNKKQYQINYRFNNSNIIKH